MKFILYRNRVRCGHGRGRGGTTSAEKVQAKLREVEENDDSTLTRKTLEDLQSILFLRRFEVVKGEKMPYNDQDLARLTREWKDEFHSKSEQVAQQL